MRNNADIPPMLGQGRYDLPTVDVMSPDTGNKWWVLRTLGNGEKELARALEKRRIAYYLPLISVRGVNNDTLQLPMFSGYMFLYGTIHHRYDALKTDKIVQVLDVVDQGVLHWELVAISRVIESGLELRVLPRLVKGDRCEIVEGPLLGQQGTVDWSSEDNLWVTLWISTLGQSVSLRIPRIKLKALKVATQQEASEYAGANN